MKYFIVFAAGLILFSACGKQGKQPVGKSEVISTAGQNALDPCFSYDAEGNPVLSWSEEQPGASPGQRVFELKYAHFNIKEQVFGPTIAVSSSKGLRTSAESAARVAFKADGTVLALFGKRFSHPSNPYAGAIQYTLTTDNGQSWSAPRYLHSDTLHQHGRGFFDMEQLPNGELAAIWLDGRYAQRDTGLTLFYSATVPGGGFESDKAIAKNTCECCRTDLLIDKNGKMHIAYRSIAYPPGSFGKQVRDMRYISSADEGKQFSQPFPLGHDQWELEGCPHSGPSLAQSPSGIWACWFTAGKAGSPGVYRAKLNTGSTQNNDDQFGPRELLDASWRHPQSLGFPGGRLAMVAESQRQGKPEGHDAAHGAASAIIQLRLFETGKKSRMLNLTDGSSAVHHPVIAEAGSNQLLVAWVLETKTHSSIAYALVPWY